MADFRKARNPEMERAENINAPPFLHYTKNICKWTEKSA